MYSAVFLASVIGILLCVADGEKNTARKIRFSHGSDMVTMNLPLVKKSAPLNLRQENLPAISLESSNNYVKVKGFQEEAIYSGMNSGGKCIHPQWKFVSALNTCGAASDTTLGAYYMITTYADPTGNTYYFYDQYFSDSACTVATTELMYEDSAYIAICTDYDELYIARDYPLNPATDNLGFTLLTYTTQANCMTNNYEMGVLEAQYGKLNVCIQTSDSEDPTAGDVKFTSCSSVTGFVTTTYSSTDGTCSGTETVTTLPPGTCVSEPLGSYVGYMNYGCSTMVTTD
jgi:hypothetical protein